MRFLPMLVALGSGVCADRAVCRMVDVVRSGDFDADSEGLRGMRKVRVGRRVLDLYDGIDDMPIGRFHRFNRNLMVDAGIGADLQAVDSHITKTMAFMKAGKMESAVKEMENLRQSILLVHEGLSPAFSAFACLVAAVDGKSTAGWSESELDALSEELKEMTVKELRSETGEVKKKNRHGTGVVLPFGVRQPEDHGVVSMPETDRVEQAQGVGRGVGDEG